MDETSFSHWLQSVLGHFQVLSSSQQTQTLECLLHMSGPSQRWFLQQHLPALLYRDFVEELPLELQEYLFMYLDGKTLLTCCRVCKNWNRTISSLPKLWRQKCSIIGAVGEQNGNALFWKRLYRKTLTILEALSQGQMFDENETDVLLEEGKITALDHAQGYIVAGTEYGFVLCERSNSVHTFPVSCIKLILPDLVVCGHFNGILTSWFCTGTTDKQNNLQKKYRAHGSAVLTLDLSRELDLLVSGSADCTVKLWCLSGGKLLKTLDHHSHWVLRTVLKPSWTHCCEKYKNKHLILSMTREEIQLFQWNEKSEEMISYGDLETLTTNCLYIPLRSVNNFFTPGVHFTGEFISYIEQFPMNKDNEGSAAVVMINPCTGECIRRVHTHKKVRKLLAVGRRYAILLLPWLSPSSPNMMFLDLQTGTEAGYCTVPHSRSSTPDAGQITLGDTDWLNGISMTNTKGLLIALPVTGNRLRILTWKSSDT